MKLGGLVVIAGAVIWLGAFLCLPYGVHGHRAFTGAEVALALTRTAPAPSLDSATMFVPPVVWWLWWLVPALALVALALGVGLAASGDKTEQSARRLLAAGALEAAVVGLLVLLYLGTWLYAPGVFRAGTPCLGCDAAQAYHLAQRAAGIGFWVTLGGMVAAVIGGVFALIWIATEQE
jgi:hypothetical protein